MAGNLFKSRITSYNVCYTKLLREEPGVSRCAYKMNKEPEIIEVPAGKFECLNYVARITSYNVCYTKLLRYFYLCRLLIRMKIVLKHKVLEEISEIAWAEKKDCYVSYNFV